MTSYVTPKKNTAFITYIGLPSVASANIFKVNPTLAAGDAKVSIDGGAFANLTTLPVVTPAGGAAVKISLSADEMNGDNIVVLLSDASGGEWKDVLIPIQTTATQIDGLAGAVWDEVLTGATHNIATSAGRRLRQVTATLVHDGIAQGAGTGTNQIQLDVAASSVSGSYDPSLISIIGGTGIGQSRVILDYNGATRTATVDRDWRVVPDATSEFVIVGDQGREHVNEGLAQGGTSTSITLNASASAYDDTYNNQLVFIRSGVGADQIKRISDYNGTTKVATVTDAFNVTPTTQSGYVIFPAIVYPEAPTATENADALLNRDMSVVSDTNARSPLNAMRALRNKITTVGGLTVYKENDTTAAWTATLTEDAAAELIVTVDPA